MEAQLAFLQETKMFDGVGHVNLPAIDAGLLQRLIQQTPGRSDERLALPVLLIARLLA